MALTNKIVKSKNAIGIIRDELSPSDNDNISTNLVSEEKEAKIKRLKEENKELKETIVELAIELYGNKDKIINFQNNP